MFFIRRSRDAHRLVALVFAGALLGGCNAVPIARTVVEAARDAQNSQKTGSRIQFKSVDESYAQSLLASATNAPAPTPGLVVCEPVSQIASGELLDFATGCARWLHLHTSGHGELGQTPLWGRVADARDVLPRADLRLNSADAARFAPLVGATHIALGTIGGDATRATLSYQLYRAQPKMQAQGAPLVASGTREQIIAKLPDIARQLAKSLGVKSPRVALSPLAPADFTLLGSAPWKAKTPVAPAVKARLVELSAREPLAGLLYLRSGKPGANKALFSTALNNLMTTAPQNTVVVADVARFYLDDIAPHHGVITKLRARYPRNYLAATSEMQLQQHLGEWTLAQDAAEDAVRLAPRHSRAWLDLNNLLGDYAQSIRGSKYTSKMTASERRTVFAIYPQQLSAAWRARQLTPQDTNAWSEVALAATFNGNDALADTALWKAHALDKTNNSVYSWGLQMYQPKWGGDGAKLLQIARLAVQNADPDPDNFPADNLVGAIFHGGLKDQREELLTAAIARSPKSAVINYEYGAILHYDKRDYVNAEKHYLVALAGDPQNARALGSLGDLHRFVKNDAPGAERLYKQAIANAPGDTSLSDKLKSLKGAGGAGAPL